MSTRTKIIFAVCIAIVLLIGGYLLFFNTNASDTAITTDAAPTSDAETTFLNLASQAQPIHFDTAIFTDPRFTALTDTRTIIVPVPTGRPDPFAPVPGISTN